MHVRKGQRIHQIAKLLVSVVRLFLFKATQTDYADDSSGIRHEACVELGAPNLFKRLLYSDLGGEHLACRLHHLHDPALTLTLASTGGQMDAVLHGEGLVDGLVL